MTDKKLTDSEIVKALNQCACRETNCYGCPYWDASNCSDRLCMDALDLINRLQAEIEKLKKSRDRWRQLAEDFDRITREEEMVGENNGITE